MRAFIFAIALMVLGACQAEDESLSAAPLAVTPCIRTADMPTGLRMQRYRAPTPDCVPKGQTLDIAALQALLQTEPKPILIDVWAILLRTEEGFGSEWLPNETHYSLPNAVWLPNVGYGKLKPLLEDYLQQNLQRLTQGDKTQPLVFFCVADCWMSWNTVQRVHEYGYSKVYWYKNGTDGWDEVGLPLEVVEPVPIHESSSKLNLTD